MLLYLVILVIIVYFAIKKKETFSSNIAIQKQSYRGCENDKFNEKLHNKYGFTGAKRLYNIFKLS